MTRLFVAGIHVRVWAFAALVMALASPAASAAPDERAFGVQLHLHGSMSEGLGSMRGHDHAASELGEAVDVIWWTDHDWRIAGYTYVERFGFEGGLQEVRPMPAPLLTPQLDGREPLPTWAAGPWSATAAPPNSVESVRVGWVRQRGANDSDAAKVQVTNGNAREGTKSLSIALRGRSAAWERVALTFGAGRRRHIASLASGVRLNLSVLPAKLRGDARIVVTALLSQQPPAHRGRIDYRLSPLGRSAPLGSGAPPGTGAPPLNGGTAGRRASVRTAPGAGDAPPMKVATVEVPYEPGRWNDLSFDVSGDAERYGLGGADNSMTEIIVSVEARDGGRVEASLDAFEIVRRRLGPALFAEQKRMASRLGDGRRRHYVGQEISYGAHLNAYGAGVPLADSTTHPHGYTPTQAVDLAHEYGGIVSLNHVFGIETTATGHNFPSSRANFVARVDRLVELRAYGADLLEVGYRARGYGLAAFVELWDTLSRSGVFITGIGVSDAHDNDVGWLEGPNNFLTWVLASSDEEAVLIDALRSGHAFFGDPARFSGRLDIEAEGGARMGDVVTVAPGRQRVTFRASGLRPGRRVRLIHDGRVRRDVVVESAAFETTEEIQVIAPTFVRFEVLDGDEVVALSNPLYFVLPGTSVPPSRQRAASAGAKR